MITETLEWFVNSSLSDGDVSLTTADAAADVHGLGSSDGIMVNHASGKLIWDALVEIADVADLAILPMGCPACVTRPALLEDLPRGLRETARIVTSGEQLVSIVSE